MFGEWLPIAQAAAEGLGKGIGSPGGPSNAQTGGYFGFDNSGWTVATSGAKAGGASSASPWILAGAALLGLLVWKLARKS